MHSVDQTFSCIVYYSKTIRHTTKHIIIGSCIKACLNGLLCQSGLCQSKIQVQTPILKPTHHFLSGRGQIADIKPKLCRKPQTRDPDK